MAEFALIAAIQARVASRADVILGIGDDAALLQPPPGMQLVVAMDTLNAGVHFPDGTAPADIGWKALAVNLSDLAAMGAAPLGYLLTVALPRGTPDGWIAAFADGLAADNEAFGVHALGGDTVSTPGPATFSLTALGTVASGAALLRSGARPGDRVLDVACGPGSTSRLIAELGAAEVVGLDTDPAVLEIAEAWRPDTAVSYVQADAQGSLPFPDDSFDVAHLADFYDLAPVAELRRVHGVAARQLLPFVRSMPTRSDPAGREDPALGAYLLRRVEER